MEQPLTYELVLKTSSIFKASTFDCNTLSGRHQMSMDATHLQNFAERLSQDTCKQRSHLFLNSNDRASASTCRMGSSLGETKHKELAYAHPTIDDLIGMGSLFSSVSDPFHDDWPHW